MAKAAAEEPVKVRVIQPPRTPETDAALRQYLDTAWRVAEELLARQIREAQEAGAG